MIDTPAAFQATVHGFRTVPSRKVVQITIEAPIEQHSTIAAIAEHGAWVAIARMQEPEKSPTHQALEASVAKEKVRTPWPDLPFTKQAVLRCKQVAFQIWAAEKMGLRADKASEENAAQYVRQRCGVNSRGDLIVSNAAACAEWRSTDSEFDVWSRM